MTGIGLWTRKLRLPPDSGLLLLRKPNTLRPGYPPMKSAPQLFALAAFMLLICAGPVAAGSGEALFGNYWQGFIEFWRSTFQKQNGVVMGVLAVGAVALFIITRGKWRK